MSGLTCDNCRFLEFSKSDEPCADCNKNSNWEAKPVIKDSGDRVNSTYRESVVRMIDGQIEKGYSKYGVLLEQNKMLTTKQRIEHLQEELIDGLFYCEHIKAISDDGMTANDYQRAALRTAGDNREDYLLNGVMGLTGEAGECSDIVKKHLFQGHELDKAHLAEELGDVAWYLAIAAEAIGYSLSDIFAANVEKLKKRYPDGFDKDRSINRCDLPKEDLSEEEIHSQRIIAFKMCDPNSKERKEAEEMIGCKIKDATQEQVMAAVAYLARREVKLTTEKEEADETED